MSLNSFTGDVGSDVSVRNARVAGVLATRTLNGGSAELADAATVLVDSPVEAYVLTNAQDRSTFDVRVFQDRDVVIRLPNPAVDGVKFTLLITASQPRDLVISTSPADNIIDVTVLRFPYDSVGTAPLPTYIQESGLAGRSFVDLSPNSQVLYIGQLAISGQGSHWKITGTLMY